jgi:hypothetical protein
MNKNSTPTSVFGKNGLSDCDFTENLTGIFYALAFLL